MGKRNFIAKIYQKHLKNSKYKLLKSNNPFYCNHYKQIIVSKISKELINILDKEGVKNISDIVGSKN